MIIGVYGYSNSGKTYLIRRLTQKLRSLGYIVSTIKYIMHEDGVFTIDTAGKDTWYHADAGAQMVVAKLLNETVFIVKHSMDIETITRIIQEISRPDIILAESCKDVDIPKIAVGDIEEIENTIFKYSGYQSQSGSQSPEGDDAAAEDEDVEFERLVKYIRNLSRDSSNAKRI